MSALLQEVWFHCLRVNLLSTGTVDTPLPSLFVRFHEGKMPYDLLVTRGYVVDTTCNVRTGNECL